VTMHACMVRPGLSILAALFEISHAALSSLVNGSRRAVPTDIATTPLD
jgi:hypothetical protein